VASAADSDVVSTPLPAMLSLSWCFVHHQLLVRQSAELPSILWL
jgi:hypothetical protein